MELPSSFDRLSSTIASDFYVKDVLCEVACYGSNNDYVCRITEHRSKPVLADWNDGYHPPADAGLLWIRSLGGQCLITGFVQKSLFPTCNDLHDFLDSIQQMLTVDQAQSKINVTVLGNGTIQTLEFNGEQVDTSYD